MVAACRTGSTEPGESGVRWNADQTATDTRRGVDLVISYAERRVAVAGQPVALTATESAVLFELSTNAGMVLTHGQLLQRVWGQGNSGEAGMVRTVVKRLREKLGDDAHNPKYIFTEPRVGYRMGRPSST